MDDITTRHDPVDPSSPGENPRVAYEHSDTDVFTLSKYAIGLAFGILIAASAMWGLFSWFQHQEGAGEQVFPKAMIEQRPQLPPVPRLQATPKLDLKELRAAEERALNNFGWVNPQQGIVHIPIEQAIDDLAKKGLPSKPAPAAEGLNSDGFRLLPEKSSSGRTVEKVAQ